MQILVGFDGSNTAKAAVQVARRRARVCGATTHILAATALSPELDPPALKELQLQLQEIQTAFADEHLACEIHLRVRSLAPAEDLLQFARNTGVDEIIIGLRRRSRTGKLLFGSTAQQIILNAPCPVVTVR